MSSKLQPAVQEELQAHLMWRYRIYLSTHHITFTFNGLTYSMSGHKSVGNLFRSSIKESTISENIIGSFDKDFSIGVVRSFEAMADNAAEHESAAESIVDKMMEKFHDYNSSSSDSDDGKDIKAKAATVKAKIYRLFGSEKPVHKVLGGGKPADIFLWREKKISAGVLGIATTIWVLFELLEYHLLTLACHILILALAILFLWSNASAFINKSSPQIPEVIIPEDIVLGVASAFRIEFNRALAILRDIASGRDLKQFLAVIAGLWLLSVLGSCWNFLTLIYIGLVLLHTVPVLYEKYEDQVDAFAEKAEAEIKKQYAVFNEKVLSKIPKGRLKDKKLA